MFIDKTKIKVVAGNGGNGIVAFISEKYMPKGGPGGGNGGDGGSIYFKADEGLSSLFTFRYNKIIKANNGENGRNKKQHGKNAQDLIIKVPCGTIVKEKGMVIADLRTHNQKDLIACGGKGGRGNASFASSKNPAPRICENGDEGESRELELELILLADVGIMGFPSVGKSTFLSVISNAKPTIAPYPFTTINPQLGIVSIDKNKNFVVADLPGLIEGASQGKGLGFKFLKHLLRCRIILHMIDVSEYSLRKDIVKDYFALRKELKKYSKKLYEKPEIVVASKIDGLKAHENIKKLQEQLPNKKIIGISSIEHKNISQLLYEVYDKLQKIKETTIADLVNESEFVYKYEFKDQVDIKIENKGNNVFVVKGETIRKHLSKNPMNTHENIKRFHHFLQQLNIEKKLIAKGAKNNDTIKVFDYTFELKI